jgi:hypothetical protein
VVIIEASHEGRSKRFVKRRRKSSIPNVPRRGEALDEGFSTSRRVRANLDFLANIDLVPGDIELVPSDKGMVMFAEGVERELVR